MMTQDQLLGSRYNTVYDAVEALHGNWLNPHGVDSFRTPSQVRVYLDNSLLGGVQTLREIAANSVIYVKYYDGITATARWGLDHGAGVIFVASHPQVAEPAW